MLMFRHYQVFEDFSFPLVFISWFMYFSPQENKDQVFMVGIPRIILFVIFKD